MRGVRRVRRRNHRPRLWAGTHASLVVCATFDGVDLLLDAFEHGVARGGDVLDRVESGLRERVGCELFSHVDDRRAVSVEEEEEDRNEAPVEKTSNRPFRERIYIPRS